MAPAAFAFLPNEVLSFALADALRVGRWGLVAGIVLLGIAVLYRFGPDVSGKRPWITAGALLAAGLWFQRPPDARKRLDQSEGCLLLDQLASRIGIAHMNAGKGLESKLSFF